MSVQGTVSKRVTIQYIFVLWRIAASKYLDTNPLPIDHLDFDKQCGVGKLFWHSHPRTDIQSIVSGFSITPAEIALQVANYITSSAASSWANLDTILGGLRTTPDLRWANPLEVKSAVEAAFTEKFGAKEAGKPKGKVSRRLHGSACYLS